LAYRPLPMARLPEVEYPTITVFANLPGASPETMATAVATPLERMFGRIAGITQMTSNSQLGSTNITMQFDLHRNVDGAARDAQSQYTLQGDNLQDLLALAPVVEQKLRTIREIQDVNNDLQSRALKAELVIDRDTAARLGLSPQTIDNALYDAFGQRQVPTMYKGINQYHVVIEVAQQFQQSPDALKKIYIRSTTGREIPLSAFTHYESSTTSLAVAHQGQFPAITFPLTLPRMCRSERLSSRCTPVVYLYMDRFRAWVSGGKALRPLEDRQVENKPEVSPQAANEGAVSAKSLSPQATPEAKKERSGILRTQAANVTGE
jgi:multidrug efflux pump subunit AcrB